MARATHKRENHLGDVQPDDHAIGSSIAPVTVISYCDFECPYCRRAAPAIKRLIARYGGELRFVYRHFPLIDKHPAALRAAEAAEAAAEQGKFWEMHDMLFQNQDELEHEDLLAYADTLGLELRRFADDLLSHRHLTRIERDMNSGVSAGVRGTPTFYVNGVRNDDERQLESAIAAELSAIKGG